MCNPLLGILLPFIHTLTLHHCLSFCLQFLLLLIHAIHFWGPPPRDLFFPRASAVAVIYKWLSAILFVHVGHGVIAELTKGLELIIDEALASGDCRLSTWRRKKCRSLKQAGRDEAQMHRWEGKHQKTTGVGDYLHVTAWTDRSGLFYLYYSDWTTVRIFLVYYGARRQPSYGIRLIQSPCIRDQLINQKKKKNNYST